MKKYLLPEKGTFYKANLHCHSTVSDGKWTPEEIKQKYMEHGYSIIAYTDHDVLISHADLADEFFLPLTGIEYGVSEGPGSYTRHCDICMIALTPDNLIQPCWHRTKYLSPSCTGKYKHLVKFDESKSDFEREYSHERINKMIAEGRETGFFVTYNHPGWSLERYNDYMGYENMHAMEICNYSCVAGGHSDYNDKEYDDMLRGGKRIYCIATDDNHNKSEDSFGGFTMIKAKRLEYKTITAALLKGEFYASQGPEIYALWIEDGYVNITCSEAKTIIMNTGGRRTGVVKAEDGKPLCSAKFEIAEDAIYIRITVTDFEGRHANTNAYFTDEL